MTTDVPQFDELVVVDSVTHLDGRHRGMVAVAASHGGAYTAAVATTLGLRGFVCNDAGFGRDRAGVRVLDLLDEIGLAAATIDHRTGLIGDGGDCLRNGTISLVNATTRRLGCVAGQSTGDVVACMMAAEPSPPREARLDEARFELEVQDAAVPVWGIDSASLAGPEDRGAVLVTGSHGALLGGRPESALKADARAAVFNDAGGGPDGRGTSRLPVLDTRGIAAVTVGADSAAIGSARSSYSDGRISAMNRHAKRLGARSGMPAGEFVALAARSGT